MSEILGKHSGEYSASFARRAMADLAFKDKLANYYVVDVKTHVLVSRIYADVRKGCFGLYGEIQDSINRLMTKAAAVAGVVTPLEKGESRA